MLNETDLILGKLEIKEDFIVINHILLLGKYYIYFKKCQNSLGLIDSPNCTFCQEDAESIEHLLFSCRISSEFWKHVLS